MAEGSCALRSRPVLAAARYVEDSAGDVGSLVGHQPDDGACDFLWGTDPLHRNHGTEPVSPIRFTAAGVDFGVDEPWPDRGHANALAGHLMAEPYRERIDRAL